ncbi:MAG: hypothetical protein KBS64_04525 [Treponema sp.]|nr:hypothetical protein [Candidatus Treponema equi]
MKKNEEVRKIRSYNPVWAYIYTLLHPVGAFSLIRYLVIVIYKFFLLQYFEKFHLYRIPVKNVDHQLDSTVPFREDTEPVYLDFINYWIRPLTMMVRRLGYFKGIKFSINYLRTISYTYNHAYKVYKKHLTTTRRPKGETRAVRNIQKADPHYCCVPSLHIAVIILTISFYKKHLDRDDLTEQEKKEWNEEIYSHGVAIAESVLYMKQHSVNCIPAAMFMMTMILPDYVERGFIEGFINDLFVNSNDVTDENKDKIRRYILDFYSNLMEQCKNPDMWHTHVLEWIKNYQPSD